MDDDGSNKKLAGSLKDVSPYIGLGSQLAATIIILFFVGRWLDSNFSTEPLFTILFALFGGFAGIYNFIKTVLQMNKKKSETDK